MARPCCFRFAFVAVVALMVMAFVVATTATGGSRLDSSPSAHPPPSWRRRRLLRVWTSRSAQFNGEDASYVRETGLPLPIGAALGLLVAVGVLVLLTCCRKPARVFGASDDDVSLSRDRNVAVCVAGGVLVAVTISLVGCRVALGPAEQLLVDVVRIVNRQSSPLVAVAFNVTPSLATVYRGRAESSLRSLEGGIQAVRDVTDANQKQLRGYDIARMTVTTLGHSLSLSAAALLVLATLRGKRDLAAVSIVLLLLALPLLLFAMGTALATSLFADDVCVAGQDASTPNTARLDYLVPCVEDVHILRAANASGFALVAAFRDLNASSSAALGFSFDPTLTPVTVNITTASQVLTVIASRNETVSTVLAQVGSMLEAQPDAGTNPALLEVGRLLGNTSALQHLEANVAETASCSSRLQIADAVERNMCKSGNGSSFAVWLGLLFACIACVVGAIYGRKFHASLKGHGAEATWSMASAALMVAIFLLGHSVALLVGVAFDSLDGFFHMYLVLTALFACLGLWMHNKGVIVWAIVCSILTILLQLVDLGLDARTLAQCGDNSITNYGPVVSAVTVSTDTCTTVEWSYAATALVLSIVSILVNIVLSVTLLWNVKSAGDEGDDGIALDEL